MRLLCTLLLMWCAVCGLCGRCVWSLWEVCVVSTGGVCGLCGRCVVSVGLGPAVRCYVPVVTASLDLPAAGV